VTRGKGSETSSKLEPSGKRLETSGKRLKTSDKRSGIHVTLTSTAQVQLDLGYFECL
jgi:hypothetical protein